jgi:putative ABC transport system substrate-binding protein
VPRSITEHRYLSPYNSRDGAETGRAHPLWRAFFAELERRGFTEGHNLEVERYSGEGRPDRYSGVAKEVVTRSPTVVFAVTTRLIYFVKRFSTTIPIVGVTTDPIATGLTLSLAKPSGNVTGVTDTVGRSWENGSKP